MAKKATSGTTSSSPIQDNSIDLSNVQLLDLSEENSTRLRKQREGFESAAKPAIDSAITNPSALGLSKKLSQSLPTAQQELQEAETLLQYEQWLEKKLELVRETRLFRLASVRKVTNQLVRRARTLQEESPEEATPYAELIDHYARPAKKASSTRKKNKKASDDS